MYFKQLETEDFQFLPKEAQNGGYIFYDKVCTKCKKKKSLKTMLNKY